MAILDAGRRLIAMHRYAGTAKMVFENGYQTVFRERCSICQSKELGRRFTATAPVMLLVSVKVSLLLSKGSLSHMLFDTLEHSKLD